MSFHLDLRHSVRLLLAACELILSCAHLVEVEELRWVGISSSCQCYAYPPNKQRQ